MKEKKEKLKYVAADVKLVFIEVYDVISTSVTGSEDPSGSMPDGTWQ